MYNETVHYKQMSIREKVDNIGQRNGYLPLDKFRVIDLENNDLITGHNNIPDETILTCLEFLIKMKLGSSPNSVFMHASESAKRIALYRETLTLEIQSNPDYDTNKNYTNISENVESIVSALITGITKRPIDDIIRDTCQLIAYHNNYYEGTYIFKGDKGFIPDMLTINNIKVLYRRFLKTQEELDDFKEMQTSFGGDGCFTEDGYSLVVGSGTCDYLTRDGVYAITISDGAGIKDTLRSVMYYVMGVKSKLSKFSFLEKIGIIDLYDSKIYLLDVEDIPLYVIDDVVNDVMEYRVDIIDFRDNLLSAIMMRCSRED